MIKTFHSGNTLPSRHHLMDLIEKKCEATVQKVKAEIKNAASKNTLTTHAWTNIATEAYLGVTCLFVSQDWKLASYTLTIMPLEERHTAENWGWVEKTAEKCGFFLKDVLNVVHDNTANAVVLSTEDEERHVASHRCVGQTLQLVVNHTLMKDSQISKALGLQGDLLNISERVSWPTASSKTN